MTRGQKGCFLYCVDAETNEYFKRLSADRPPVAVDKSEPYPGLTLRILEPEEVRPYENSRAGVRPGDGRGPGLQRSAARRGA